MYLVAETAEASHEDLKVHWELQVTWASVLKKSLHLSEYLELDSESNYQSMLLFQQVMTSHSSMVSPTKSAKLIKSQPCDCLVKMPDLGETSLRGNLATSKIARFFEL